MSWPDHLLTLEEFERLPEDNSRRYELQEGVLHVTPKAASLHQRVVLALGGALNRQLSAEWEALHDLEVVLASTFPPTLRIPDLVVAASDLIDSNPNRLHATEVMIAIEVISPGSRETDRVAKTHEYANAGIPFYWIVDLDDPVTLTACRLAGNVYKTDFHDAGTFEMTDPVELSVDVERLVRRRDRPA